MKVLLKFLTASALLALPSIGHSTDIPSSSSVAVYLQNSSGTTICSFLAASASYQVTNTVSTTSSTGFGAGKAAVGPLTIEKSVDNCSSTLLYDTVTSGLVPHVFVVIAPPSGSTGQSTFVLETSNAAITSFTDATSKTLKLEETVSFAYESLAIAETSGTSVGTCFGYAVSASKADTSGCSAIANFLASKPALPTTY